MVHRLIRPRKLTFSSILVSSLCQPALAVQVHSVKAGETLSGIAHANLGNPVYTSRGSLRRLLAMNPQIEHQNQIRIGEKVYLPDPLERDVAGSADGESASIEEAAPSKASGLASSPQPVRVDQLNPLSPASFKSDEHRVPVVTAVPTPPPEAEKPSEISQVGELGAGVGFAFSAVDSRDKASGGKTSFISDLSPVVDLHWRYRWTKEWSSFLRFGVTFEEIQNDTSASSKRLSATSGTRKTVAFGASHHWSERTATSMSVGMRDQFFAHSPSASELQIDRIPSGDLRLSHRQALFQVRRACGFVEVGADWILGSSAPPQTTKDGSSVDVALGTAHDFQKLSVETKVFYGSSTQESNLVEQSEKQLGALLGVSWRFDP